MIEQIYEMEGIRVETTEGNDYTSSFASEDVPSFLRLPKERMATI